MKLLMMMFLCVTLTGHAQDLHKQMLVEGRSWNIRWVKQTSGVDTIKADVVDVQITTHATYTVTGKTVVRDKQCYSINRSFTTEVEPANTDARIPNPTDVIYMYEEDGKVYSYTPNFSDGWQLEFDNNLQPGETLIGNTVVERIDTIDVKGERYRRFTFKNGSPTLCWVEGIGHSMFGMVSGINTIISTDGPILEMKTLSVYDGDRCIFNADDFTAEAERSSVIVDFTPDDPNGIACLSTDNTSTTSVYDLQGRRLSQKPEKGVYIENGRKVVVK